jgi:hypothetical protein
MNDRNQLIDDTITALEKITEGNVTNAINAALYSAATLAKAEGISRAVFEQGASATFDNVFGESNSLN